MPPQIKSESHGPFLVLSHAAWAHREMPAMAAGLPVMLNALCSSSTCRGSCVLLCLYGSPAMGWKNPCRRRDSDALSVSTQHLTVFLPQRAA